MRRGRKCPGHHLVRERAYGFALALYAAQALEAQDAAAFGGSDVIEAMMQTFYQLYGQEVATWAIDEVARVANRDG